MWKLGKIGKRNEQANRKIAQMWIDKDIQFCEVCPILHKMGMLKWECLQASSNAHRHGRVWYRKHPKKLYAFEQVIRACIRSHQFIDRKADVKEKVFIELRGKEQPD